MISFPSESAPVGLRAVRDILLRRPVVAVTLFALALYLSTLTADYYWDGLAFAGRIERVARHDHGINSLFHRNHLLYNPLAYVLYLVPRALGVSVRALTILQIISALSCTIGVAVFFQIARRISGSLYIAGVGAALLAVSTCWWKSATDADAYSLSVALVLISINAVLSQTPHWYVAGGALAGAMLIHELAILSFPAVIVAVVLNTKIESRRRFAINLSLLALGVTLGVYYACAAVLFDVKKPIDVIKWAASNPYGVPFSNPIGQLSAFPLYQVDVIFGHSLREFRRFGGAPELLFAVLGIAVAAAALVVFWKTADLRAVARSIWPDRSEQTDNWLPMLSVILVWVCPYVLFLLSWEPYLLHYRVYYVPPLALLFVLVLWNYHRRTGRSVSGAAALAIIALSFFNFAFFIGPKLRISSNPLVAAARKAKNKWDEHTVIYFTENSPADGAFRYFNITPEWRVTTPKALMKLDDEIRRIYAAGGTVWVNDSASKSIDHNWLADRAYGDVINVESGNTAYHYVQLLPPRSSFFQ